MFQSLSRYRKIEGPVRKVLLAEFCLQPLNTTYIFIVNFFLLKNGYTDTTIASLISTKFLGILAFSIVFGFLLKGRKLLPVFRITSLLTPLFSFAVIWAVPRGHEDIVRWSFALYGSVLSLFMVGLVPFIMREAKSEYRSEAIALHFSAWSISTFITGILIYATKQFPAIHLDEELVFILCTVLSLGAPLILFRMKYSENIDVSTNKQENAPIQWKKVSRALFPNFVMGIGSGMTIPFMSLFFYHQFQLDFTSFSLVGALSTFIVATGSIYIPSLRKKVGLIPAVIGSKSLGIIALISLAVTGLFPATSIVFALAVFFYLIRQPLMNMSWPLVSEFTMDYVGKDSREVVSALRTALWSGSWFFSARLFAYLRELNVSYASIFFITAGIYTLATAAFYVLMKENNPHHPGGYRLKLLQRYRNIKKSSVPLAPGLPR